MLPARDHTLRPPPDEPVAAIDYWRTRAVWAENALIIVEREILEVERHKLGGRKYALDVLWRLRARYPRTMERLTAHRDREQERRLTSRLYRRRRA